MKDEAIFSSLPVPVMVVDRENLIVRINAAAEEFFMFSTRAATGKSLFEKLRAESSLMDALRRVRENDSPVFLNDTTISPGLNKSQQCSMQIAPLAGSPGNVILQISPREFADRLTQGGVMRVTARSFIDMADILTHEIKNPLAGITGAAQLLQSNLGQNDWELADIIVNEARRIAGLLDQMEQFGNSVRPRLKAINIHDVLDRARRSAEVGFAAGMNILVDYDPSLPLAMGDSNQLQQVVQNLIKNAAEAAGGQGGTILLRSSYNQSLRIKNAEGNDKWLPLQIEVIDDGPGLPDDIVPSMFEPFVSGRKSGKGLGLALAAKIISDHDGWISVDAEPGQTIFRISLMMAPSDMGND
ncbi:MAG: ATP-binding protein [Roseovarius sp.]|nr:ATP-binding protein [Roseovarius sp.]